MTADRQFRELKEECAYDKCPSKGQTFFKTRSREVFRSKNGKLFHEDCAMVKEEEAKEEKKA